MRFQNDFILMWLVLAFVSATFLGFYDTSKKASLKDNAVLPVLFLNTIFSTLIFSPFLLDYLGDFGWFSGTFLDTAPFGSGTQYPETQAINDIACRPGDAGSSGISLITSNLHSVGYVLQAHLR